MIYLKTFTLPSDEAEWGFIMSQHRNLFNGIYPFKIFPQKQLKTIRFAPVTIFCGENGSGKSTLLNVIACKLKLLVHSVPYGGPFFPPYVDRCTAEGEIPNNSQRLITDDIFDYMLHLRTLNEDIDEKRKELFDDYNRRRGEQDIFHALEDHDDWKDTIDAKKKTQSAYVNERLIQNVEMHSNGEVALRYYTRRITENALYLMDEPENSLSIPHQLEICKFIADSVRYYGCQFVIATHSPIFLSIPNARIYDLDAFPVTTKKWTELKSVRCLFDFFQEHREELSESFETK